MHPYADLELCKKLVEAGAPREANRWWEILDDCSGIRVALVKNDWGDKSRKCYFVGHDNCVDKQFYYPAYSIDQLMEFAPEYTQVRKYGNGNGFVVGLARIIPETFPNKRFEDPILVNALAEYLLYLLSHGCKFQNGKVVKE